MKTILLGIAMLAISHVSAQINENFSDGNFTANPSWTGNTADWSVNTSLQLQSANTTANSSFYLSTASTAATVTQWEFYFNLQFNPSSTNYADVYLTASAADLLQTNTTGYFVRLGNTNDEIALYRKDANGTSTKIIDGQDLMLNASNNIFRIRVTRNAADLWTLSRDITATGNSYISEGTVTDHTYISSAFFGILVKQSSSSFFQKHIFDEIKIGPYVPDLTPPVLVSATAVSPVSVEVLFNESLDPVSAQVVSNYIVNTIGSPATAVRDISNSALIHLTFADNLPPRTNLKLFASAVKDISGNGGTNGSVIFAYYTPLPYDIIIDELMADPSPQVQLPNNEWLELKNTTNMPINLQGWKLGKASGESGPMPDYILQPDSFAVICSSSSAAQMNLYGPAKPVSSFPSLNNDADRIWLRAPQGMIVHAVNYTDEWYHNQLKKEGGWTMEMIDTHNPCNGIDNWRASADPHGGTPATINSVDGNNPDQQSPKLLRATAPDPLHLILIFNEPLDSISAANTSFYLVSDGIGMPVNALPLSVSFDRVQLTLGMPLLPHRIYRVTARHVKDCAGNEAGNDNTVRVGLPEPTGPNEIAINELLFNPRPSGVDYAEFYNRSKNILNLKNAYIANRNAAGQVASIAQFTADDYLFFPGDYIVLSSDPVLVQREYFSPDPAAFLPAVSMPSFNDDAGDLVLLNDQGAITDELIYSQKWHFPLISDPEGVSLERINPDAAATQQNFHSAAKNIGYGTPGYKNSQYRTDEEAAGTITVTSQIISPDNDGMDDFATIEYNFPEPGYVLNITVFDASGRTVRYLQQSALCGIKGFYRWDGLGERQMKLATGVYIIYTEAFNLKGKVKRFKNLIVLARKN